MIASLSPESSDGQPSGGEWAPDDSGHSRGNTAEAKKWMPCSCYRTDDTLDPVAVGSTPTLEIIVSLELAWTDRRGEKYCA